MNFKGKVVLVTGGSKGIGKSIAVAFAGAGASVVINYNSDEKTAQETLQTLNGGMHLKVKADISKIDEVGKMVDTIIRQFGRLDILVNNAGIFKHHLIEEDPVEVWQKVWSRTIEVNLTGTANVCYYAVRQMIDQGGGKIINITSRGAFRGEPESPGYGASKAGMNSLSQSLAVALAPYNIFVFAIAPGWVETDMTRQFLDEPEGEAIRLQSPLRRTAKPEEIAYATLMVAGDGSEYMTGAIIDVNGGSYLRS
ncbi:MAG: SDR family oxidoreductase [Bacteroidetes bacterium]|nr:SDR family oxidoreductase [Bacteroidota bacterium]